MSRNYKYKRPAWINRRVTFTNGEVLVCAALAVLALIF